MTKPPKTMEEIKQEWINEAFELEKAKAYKCCESCGNNFSNANTYFHYGFKAGFDCRDRLDNEALKLAVKTLAFYAEESAWVKTTRRGDCILARDDNSTGSKSGMFGGGNKAREALAEIRKIRGDI